MKTLLRWLFTERMYDLEKREFDEACYRDRAMRRNHVAEQFLKQLGYEIQYDSGVREQPSETTHASQMGYKLVKIK